MSLQNVPDIYVGALLTFLSLVVIEFIKTQIITGRARKNFVVFTKLELKSVVKNLDRLKAKAEENSYFDFSVLNDVDKAILDLESARPDAIYLSDPLQEDYFDLITRLRGFSNDSRFLQNYLYDQTGLIENKKSESQAKKAFDNIKELNTFFNQRKLEKLVELIDLKRSIEEFIKNITQKN